MINYRLHRFTKLITQILILSTLFFSLSTLTGCGPQWKKKFVRKRADRRPEQVFTYESQKYEREPNDVLYKRHFIFWKAWQEELITKLGNNKKSDISSFEEALKSLDEMKDCLKEEKAVELEVYIKRLRDFYILYKSKEFDIIRSSQMRQDLDRLMLKMDKIFRYNRVKDFIL